MRAVVGPLVGIVSVKLPDVTVCDEKVYDPTDLLERVELYSNAQSVVNETVVHDTLALGVQYAVVPELVGAVAFVTVAPPAV